MANILFLVFSGQASAIFDEFLYSNQERYINNKAKGLNYPINFVVETQWDNGGHTGFMLDFYDWVKKHHTFNKVFNDDFYLPPPMGDLKTQISRWSSHLLHSNQGEQISHLIGGRYVELPLAINGLSTTIKILNELNRKIFNEEDLMNFLQTFINLYSEFAKDKVNENHSVGNLFLSFLYFYSFLIKDKMDAEIYSHHHEIFFNFLKDLQLVPRGCRFEFLIDGRYELSGESEDGSRISGEKYFDDYQAKSPIIPSTYSIQAVDGQDIDSKFGQMALKSDVIVIPPGSLSNWMPIINKFRSFLIQKPIIWIVNSFYHTSEISLDKQCKYLLGQGLSPIILAPNVDSPFQGLSKENLGIFEEKYKQQDKLPVDFTRVFNEFNSLNVFRCIPLKELEPGEGGIKYKSEFIENFLSALSLKSFNEKSKEDMPNIIKNILNNVSN